RSPRGRTLLWPLSARRRPSASSLHESRRRFPTVRAADGRTAERRRPRTSRRRQAEKRGNSLGRCWRKSPCAC
ncbi:hypothetical protein IscW_ISCW004735, partial [Ixodes scapularis]